MITVITRTSSRPNYFRNCRFSILQQTCPAWHLVVSDDPADTYPEGDDVVRLPIRSQGRGCNSYFNWVRDKIPDAHPWVMFLDDDDFFLWDNALEILQEQCTDPNRLLLWQVQFHDRVVPGAEFGQPPAPGNISGIGFCYHKSHWVDWPGVAFGDYMVISQLYMKLRPVWIDGTLTGLQTVPGHGSRRDLENVLIAN